MPILKRMLSGVPGYDRLRDLVATESSRVMLTTDLMVEQYRAAERGLRVLDLGCGEGHSMDWLAAVDPTVDWHGVDIEDSPEVRRRSRHDLRIQSFDGVNLPYPEAHFDFIYCAQVFEHVREPHRLIRDVCRVLKPGGRFVGSVAYLEPYHSYSVFNVTPFGMTWLMEFGGLVPERLYHRYDCFYSILRQFIHKVPFVKKLRRVSPLYVMLEVIGRLARLDRRDINLLKMQYCGSFAFVARKPSG